MPTSPILLVSLDRSLLRQGSLMLEEFGVVASACADPATVPAAIAAGVDVIVVSDDALRGDLRQVAQWKENAGRHVHVLLATAEGQVDIRDALDAGIDDFLRRPLNAGELLARLRAAVRYCQFERRYQSQAWEDAISGLWSRQGLIEQLGDELRAAGKAQKVSVVVVELDYFDDFARAHGQALSRRALRAAAELLQERAAPGQVAARIDVARFALALPNQTLETTQKFAEELRDLIAELTIDELAGQHPFTASVGVAVSADNDTAEDLLQRGEGALVDAQQRGRDGVATHGQYDDDRRRWSQQVSGGNLFAGSLARDVLTPFTIELGPTDTLAYAETLFAQTRLEVLPVVDFHGRLAGIVERETICEAFASGGLAGQSIEPLISRDAPKLAENTPLEKVVEHFAAGDHPILVVVSKDGRGRGLIAREQFLNLVHPIDDDALAAGEFSAGTDYLVVPETV